MNRRRCLPKRQVSWALLVCGCVQYKLQVDTEATAGAPEIVVEPVEIDFGAAPLSSTLSRPLRVDNVGTAALSVSGVEIAGVGAGSYTLVEGGEPFSLAPGESAGLTVVYTAVSTAAEATLFVHSDDPVRPALGVPLTAQPLIGQLYASPNPIDFGATAAGGEVDASTTVSNVGTYDVVVDEALVVGDAFALGDIPALPWRFAPGDAMELPVSFSPDADGLYVGQLWLNADDAVHTHLVGLIGTAGDATDEESDDDCLQDTVGYEAQPEAILTVTDSVTPITLTFLGSDAGYSNDFWVEAPEVVFFANGHADSPGITTTIGPYPVGTEVMFGLRVRDTGDHWYTGPAARNSDRAAHAAIAYRGECSWTVGFEDLNGGGDQDFNDLTVLVSGPLIVE